MTPSSSRRVIIYRTGQVVIAAFECYVLAEIVYHTLNNGERRLYEVATDSFARLRERIEFRAQVLDTLRMIRRLPE